MKGNFIEMILVVLICYVSYLAQFKEMYNSSIEMNTREKNITQIDHNIENSLQTGSLSKNKFKITDLAAALHNIKGSKEIT